MFLRLSALAAVAAAEPMVQVALAPPEGAASRLSGFGAHEQSMEAQGLAQIQAAMNRALTNAGPTINAAVHGSFLQTKSEPIYIRVQDGLESMSTGRAQKLENWRDSMEGKTIAQSAGEFDALTGVNVR